MQTCCGESRRLREADGVYCVCGACLVGSSVVGVRRGRHWQGEKKASSVYRDIVTREYTINMHKRLIGQCVPVPARAHPSLPTPGAEGQRRHVLRSALAVGRSTRRGGEGRR